MTTSDFGLRTSVGGLVIAALAAACGPSAQFRLTSSVDNDRAQIAAALAARQLPDQPAPINAARQPRVFAVIAGPHKQLAAYDLASHALLWKVPAEVSSRVWVGGDFVVDLELGQLVARSQQNGAVRWHAAIDGELAGAAADRDRAYATWRRAGSGSTWRLAAFDGASGDELWHADADGQLGAPAAQGGVVFSPYLSQWLSLVDGKTGHQLARLRGIDEQISIVRATSTTAYYGSRRGVFVLDARSAAGSRAGATYGRVAIPPQLDRATYGRDMYDPIQIGYTAADRARVLWTGEPTDAGAMKLAGDEYAVHYFRYVFGFSATGELVWAYQHPRVELVASDTTGPAIVALGQDGELVALDAKTGAVRLTQQLPLGGIVLGATFDADGWSPPAAASPEPDPIGTLVAIARDHDARFDRVKELAVTALAKLPGGDVTKGLLAVLADDRAPQKLKDSVSELLARRKDPSSLPTLVEQLAVHADYLAGTQPDALGPVARAIAGLAGLPLPPTEVTAALAALRTHLDAPSTQSTDLVLVIGAMAAIGGGAERPALVAHLLLNHADDDLGGDAAWSQAIVHALHEHGGSAERELLRQVASDPRTKPVLSHAIEDAIAAD
jgi:hypothetical protein